MSEHTRGPGKPPDPAEGRDSQPTERFTKSSDLLIGLGLPPRLVLLYGKLAYRAAIGWHDLNHGELAKEIGIGCREQVQRLLKQLQRLRLIEWKRSRYWNIYRVLDPDVAFLQRQMRRKGHISKDPDVTSTSHLDRSRCDLQVTSDVTLMSHLDARYKEVRSKKEEEHPPTPRTPPSPKQQKLPGLCASDDARVSGESALAIIPRSGKGREGWFDAWWAIYWRKVAKKAAERAFEKNIKTEERFRQVMAATRAQTAMMMGRDPDKRPHGATWLNDERWNDEPSVPATARKPPGTSLGERVKARWRERIAKGERPL